MESNKSTDFRANIADLTKIPPNEFEKYFQDWMERDDVARSLQAKLRCDLIKNFNKTYLGKHILSHTMTSSGGSTMRLTLSPLVLALNTLVGEFLYSQNCHFTLSVFCTEIPFRNTLPDFESMRRFRFNNEEISEIWQAVTGSKANKQDLNKNIIHNYSANPNISLLLLIIKYLLQKDLVDHTKRNAEVQTEIQEKMHKSTSAQALDRDRKASKAIATDDNLDHINKYLLTLSDKVIEMTKEFEQFAKQRRESRPRTLKSSRSREYYALNKSLERITENMKTMAQAKRKNKRLSTIVESIDNLTQQFGKCAQNFDNVTKFLGTREDRTVVQKSTITKVKLKEKQTETELNEKSYNDWIYEMRNTENGKKFLSRVEISLRKALTKYLDKLRNETDIKMKHLKSLMRLHYQQKLAKHLMQEPKTNLEETRRCNDNIEKKLEQFESKQMELLQKLQESSLELKEAQLQQKNNSTLFESQKLPVQEGNHYIESTLTSADKGNRSEHELKTAQLQGSQNADGNMNESQFDHNIEQDKDSGKILKPCPVTEEKTTESSFRDVSKAQEEIVCIPQNIAEQQSSVDHIIYDAKLRIQQLENESNQLEQNFQSYLERRKRSQEENKLNEKISKISPLIRELYDITNIRLTQVRSRQEVHDELAEDKEVDKEFQHLKETLQHQDHEPTAEKQKTAKSDSSTSSLEIKNAILEAKLKFFEQENTIRKCREQEQEIRTSRLLQQQLEKYSEFQELPQANLNVVTETVDNYRHEYNLESSLSENNIKDKSLDDEQDIDLSPLMRYQSQKSKVVTPTSVRRELFPKDIKLNMAYTPKTTSSDQDLHDYLRSHETATAHSSKAEYDFKNRKATPKPDTTSQLIKQSMAKMQQLFEEQSKSQETLREMVNELQHGKVLQREQSTARLLHMRSNETLDKSLATTMTSTTTATTSTTKTSIKTETNDHISLNRISNTSVPSLLNLSIESDSMDSIHQEIEMTADTPKQNDEQVMAAAESKSKSMDHVNESFDSSELQYPHSPNKKYQTAEENMQLELGQLIDSAKLSDLNLYSSGNDNEIGEISFEPNRSFAPIDTKLDENFSSRSTSDLEISTGQQDKDAKNLGDDSESDFWA